MEEGLKVALNEQESRFEVILGSETAMIEFVIQEENNRIIFTHTGVPKAFAGKGIASKMAAAAFEYADKQGLKISSLCSYIDAWTLRHPEYDHLRYKRE